MKDRRAFLRRSAAAVSGRCYSGFVGRASAEPLAGESRAQDSRFTSSTALPAMARKALASPRMRSPGASAATGPSRRRFSITCGARCRSTTPLALGGDEVYAVSAYVLFLNGIVSEDAVMNAQSLPPVKMPNRDGFISDWPPRPRN